MEAPAALAPAVAEVGVLVDVRLVEVDQQVAVALGALQQALKLRHKGVPPLRISPSKELSGFLPRQLEAVQGRADGLAAKQAAEALPHVGDQAPEGPARRRVSAYYGCSGGAALCLAHGF